MIAVSPKSNINDLRMIIVDLREIIELCVGQGDVIEA